MYYNPITKEIKSRYDIKKLYPNISLPKEFEQYEDWYKLYEGTRPTTDENQRVVQGDIELVDNKYTRTYKVEAKPEWETQREQKEERKRQVENIKVTVDDMEFDGDEVSQTRMVRTIITASNNKETTNWVLSNNEVKEVTIAQLRTALNLAKTEQTRLWTIPYSKEDSNVE